LTDAGNPGSSHEAAPDKTDTTAAGGDVSSGRKIMSKAFGETGKPDPAVLAEASERLRGEMEALALQVRDLALTLPPVQLLGWVWATVHTRILADLRKEGDDYRPDKALVNEIQFALEYLHAVWSCHADLASETTPFDEAKASELMGKLEALKELTFNYCLASSMAKHASGQDEYLTRLEYEAKSAWVNIRGHRYQVL